MYRYDRYKNGKLYTIRHKEDDSLICVGSTNESRLSARFGKHKYQNHSSLYKYIQEHDGNWDDWYIELYEMFPYDSKMQLCQREGEVMRDIGTLNKNIAAKTHKEHKEDNKDKIQEYWIHEDKIKEKQEEYIEQNKVFFFKKKAIYRKNNNEKLCDEQKERY